MTVDRRELAYDLGDSIGWAAGSALVACTWPFMWLAFHDWNDQRRQWQRLRAWVYR